MFLVLVTKGITDGTGGMETGFGKSITKIMELAGFELLDVIAFIPPLNLVPYLL